MHGKTELFQQKRLREIEDRKIEILMELASIKDDNINNNKKASKLNSEYSELHEEYYILQFVTVRCNRIKTDTML